MLQKFSRRTLAKNIAARLRTGETAADIAKQLAAYLVVNKMTDQTEMLLGDVAYELAQTGDHLYATATTAHPLSAELRQKITAYLKTHTGIAQVELAEVTDTEVIGGVRLETPSESRDATVRAKLRRLQQA